MDEEFVYDIEDTSFGDGSKVIHIANCFDNEEDAVKHVNKIKQGLKLLSIMEQDLIDWKSSAEGSIECGYAAMNAPFIKRMASVLDNMLKESKA